MKRKMFVISSIAALHLVIGGAVMLGGCTSVQEDEPMPSNARITPKEDPQTPPSGEQTPKTDVVTPSGTTDQPPVVDDPVVIDDPVATPAEKPAEKPVVTPPVKVDTPVATKKPTRENDIEYIIKKGDTYSQIALDFGVPVNDLMAYNPYPEKRLIPGQKITIPATGKKITKPVAKTTTVSVQKSYEAVPADGIYIVKKNDSFYKIAKRFGLSGKDIAEYNNLPLDKPLHVGQKLKLPPKKKAAPGKKATVAPRGKPAAAPAPAPAAPKDSDNFNPPKLDDVDIDDASNAKAGSDVAVVQIITEDTTVAALAGEYACSEMDIRKQNPHLAANGIVKCGTKIVL